MAQETVQYQTESTQYEGYLIKPSKSGDLDGVSVLFAHDFLGPGENQLSLAREYAERGALSLVADFYGSDVRPSTPEEANAEAVRVRQNIPELRAAMQEALSQLTDAGGVPEKTVVVGTSVGGLAALELGRTGEKVDTIVTLWGILENTQAESAKPIESDVVLLQGELDPLAPKSAIDTIEAELNQSQTPFETVVYNETAHAFTLPFVGTDVSTGFAYNEASATDSLNRISAILVKAASR